MAEEQKMPETQAGTQPNGQQPAQEAPQPAADAPHSCPEEGPGLAANAPTQDENYKKGVMMTLEQCAKAFEAIGVEEIEAEGKPFDPQLCAAVMQQAAPEGTESGTVTQVLQKGYTYKGKVVRHASVAVAE